MKKITCSIAVCILASSVSTSQAAGYIGASIGSTDVDIPTFDDGSSFAISGGYRINKNFAFEAAYIDLGDSSDNIAPAWTIETDGIKFSAVGIIPANEQTEVFAKVGMYMWNISVSEAGFGQFYNEDGTDLSFGFGVSVNLTEQFGLVFEYQDFEVDDEDFSNISFGARFYLK